MRQVKPGHDHLSATLLERCWSIFIDKQAAAGVERSARSDTAKVFDRLEGLLTLKEGKSELTGFVDRRSDQFASESISSFPW